MIRPHWLNPVAGRKRDASRRGKLKLHHRHRPFGAELLRLMNCGDSVVDFWLITTVKRNEICLLLIPVRFASLLFYRNEARVLCTHLRAVDFVRHQVLCRLGRLAASHLR